VSPALALFFVLSCRDDSSGDREVWPRLTGFAAEMLGSLPRMDQRAAGKLYARGLRQRVVSRPWPNDGGIAIDHRVGADCYLTFITGLGFSRV